MVSRTGKEKGVHDLAPAESCAERSFDETLACLRGLLGEGAVSEARGLVQEMQQRWPDSPQVRKWARLLKPPQARLRQGTGAPPRSQEYAWLREHAHEYPGQWLAVLGATLLVADVHLSKVLETVHGTGRDKDILLYFQPEEPWLR